MLRAIVWQAVRETWGRSAVLRLSTEAIALSTMLLVLQFVPGAPSVSEELAVAIAGGIALAVLEAARLAIAVIHLLRAHSGAIRTYEERFAEPKRHQTADWLLAIDRERWRRHRDGWVLAAHMRVENLTGEVRAVPNFVIDSGARTSSPELGAEVLRNAESLVPIPRMVGPHEAVDGWMISPLRVRFSGGRPGYRVFAEELGDWRGFTRLDVDEPRRLAIAEIPAVLEELAHHRYWGAVIQGETVAELAALNRGVRDPDWRSAAIETRSRSSSQRHVWWSQQVTTYLRDRLSRGYSLRFEAAWESNAEDASARIDAQLEVLSDLSKEFGNLRSSR